LIASLRRSNVLTDGGRRDKCKKGMVFDPCLLMKEALKEAGRGLVEGEVPVGAVIADARGLIIARAHNQPVRLNDPTAHAEILALRTAGSVCRNYRLEGATLVVTMEPCPMCMGAAVHARVARLVFGASDSKWGAAGSLYNLAANSRMNHTIEVVPGIMEQECLKLMQDFFHSRRMS
jgi:tRNA(adenine34) deaminase